MSRKALLRQRDVPIGGRARFTYTYRKIKVSFHLRRVIPAQGHRVKMVRKSDLQTHKLGLAARVLLLDVEARLQRHRSILVEWVLTSARQGY
jgi:hypothetical protein